jgi:hypothetical protein
MRDSRAEKAARAENEDLTGGTAFSSIPNAQRQSHRYCVTSFGSHSAFVIWLDIPLYSVPE